MTVSPPPPGAEPPPKPWTEADSKRAEEVIAELHRLNAGLGAAAATGIASVDGTIKLGRMATLGLDLATLLSSALAEIEKLRKERYGALLSAICKEPPCMYGTNERVYIMSLIEAARARSAGG